MLPASICITICSPRGCRLRFPPSTAFSHSPGSSTLGVVSKSCHRDDQKLRFSRCRGVFRELAGKDCNYVSFFFLREISITRLPAGTTDTPVVHRCSRHIDGGIATDTSEYLHSLSLPIILLMRNSMCLVWSSSQALRTSVRVLSSSGSRFSRICLRTQKTDLTWT